MINGYFDMKDCFNALKLFERMVMIGVKFDLVTILVIIQACAEFGCLKLGMQIHAMAIKFSYSNDLFIVNALLNMYSEIGNLELAHEVFNTVSSHDAALWNSMISTYIEYGYYDEATSLFIRMLKDGIQEDERTVIIMLDLCEKLADSLKGGKSLHCLAIKNGMSLDSSLGNALLSMYTERNCVESVKKVFSEMGNVDVVSCNTLILALARNNLKGEAWELFGIMQESEIKPNSYTVISILASCEDDIYLNTGKSIHGFVIKHGIEINQSLNTALVDMYMNCGNEAAARNLFDRYADKDLISWNALIASYVKNDNADKALLLFKEMIAEVEPNSVTILNILSSCTHVASLPLGQCLHAYIIRRESSLGFNLSLANALLTMYARCGSIRSAEKIFRSLPRKNISSWNTIITGYGLHGHGCDAIRAFKQMLEDDFQPNGVTFISLLSACSHSGLIRKGLEIFHSMVQDFNITPKLAHYGCVVDLLGRGGCLDEAKEFIRLMPIEPDASVWRALLSASGIHTDIQEAKTICENLVQLEPTNPGNYILISNIYAATGLWAEVRKIRTWLRDRGLQKPPGFSWIVVRNQVHSFTAGSRSHPLSNKIYENLSSLLFLVKESGYVPDFSCLSHDEEN
ncbi:Pentatricopeptide repeat-containing protein [Melia azedarach]|uniref:Pentatricopeptide repeat-containing protein n=1 Tax=Melia azedarach TaxID=155640 RepID=A0ACC1YML5_MELAZ|nr:Pentatricopeptide repeat-containing protein [Melia azedarach]